MSGADLLLLLDLCSSDHNRVELLADFPFQSLTNQEIQTILKRISNGYYAGQAACHLFATKIRAFTLEDVAIILPSICTEQGRYDALVSVANRWKSVSGEQLKSIMQLFSNQHYNHETMKLLQPLFLNHAKQLKSNQPKAIEPKVIVRKANEPTSNNDRVEQKYPQPADAQHNLAPTTQNHILVLIGLLKSDSDRLTTLKKMMDEFIPSWEAIESLLKLFYEDDSRNDAWKAITSTFVIPAPDSNVLIRLVQCFKRTSGRLSYVAYLRQVYRESLRVPDNLIDMFPYPTKSTYAALGLVVPNDFDEKRRALFESIESPEAFDVMILAREGVQPEPSIRVHLPGEPIDTDNLVIGSVGTYLNCRDGRTWINGELKLTEDELKEKQEYARVRGGYLNRLKREEEERILTRLKQAQPILVPESKEPQERSTDPRKACRVCKDFVATLTCVPCGHTSMCVQCCRERVLKNNMECGYCKKPFTTLTQVVQMQE